MSSGVYNKNMERSVAGWTARALARQIELPPATVASWIASDLVSAEQYGRGRRGHVVGISGLLELLAVIELRQAGFPLQAIRRAVANLRELTGQDRPLARLTLLVSGKDIVWRDSNELTDVTISALQQPGQRLMVFPIGEQHSELLRQLESRTDTESRTLRPQRNRLSHVS